MFSVAFSIRRAVQSDARHRARAYWASRHERERDPGAVRSRLGLSRDALERAAYGHLDAAPHLRRFATKALAMHLADDVWTATERHLFRDASGTTHGMPRVGQWHAFTRLPGRARSHTKERRWETFRLHGTLAGHRAAYTGTDDRFFQPHQMRCVAPPEDTWWSHEGPLVAVFSGLSAGQLVLPVRLPAAPSSQPILNHHLADPQRWHKIDLVRRRDPTVAGGWRYEAHLMVLAVPYAAPAATSRRRMTAKETGERSAGIDVNVSNITIASHASGHDVRVSRVERDARQKAGARRRAARERRRARHLDRSRRAANPSQYQWSKRQEKRARRREAAGLPPLQGIPAGARTARSDGKPLQAYRRDQLSASYRRSRAASVADAAAARRRGATTQGRSRARSYVNTAFSSSSRIATLVRGAAGGVAFSPATLLAAIEREARAVAQVAGVAGGVSRASTHSTALSQHCLCGQRVAKSLAERVHACPSCGLRGDRDAVSALLAAHVRFVDRAQPSSAVVDFDASLSSLNDARTWRVLHDTLDLTLMGRQDAPSESNAHSGHDGSSVAERGRTPDSIVVARRTVGTASRPTPDEPGHNQTTPERSRTRTNLSSDRGEKSPPLRDSS